MKSIDIVSIVQKAGIPIAIALSIPMIFSIYGLVSILLLMTIYHLLNKVVLGVESERQQGSFWAYVIAVWLWMMNTGLIAVMYGGLMDTFGGGLESPINILILIIVGAALVASYVGLILQGIQLYKADKLS